MMSEPLVGVRHPGTPEITVLLDDGEAVVTNLLDIDGDPTTEIEDAHSLVAEILSGPDKGKFLWRELREGDVQDEEAH